MTTKSIYKQIIDEFIEQLSKEKPFEKEELKSLINLLSSEGFTKDDIVNLLKEGKEDETH